MYNTIRHDLEKYPEYNKYITCDAQQFDTSDEAIAYEKKNHFNKKYIQNFIRNMKIAWASNIDSSDLRLFTYKKERTYYNTYFDAFTWFYIESPIHAAMINDFYSLHCAPNGPIPLNYVGWFGIYADAKFYQTELWSDVIKSLYAKMTMLDNIAATSTPINILEKLKKSNNESNNKSKFA